MTARTGARPRLALLGLILLAAGLSLWRWPDRDLALLAALRLAPGSALRPWMTVLTDLGGAAALIPVALVGVALLLLRRHDPRRALWLFLTVASGRLLIELVKIAIGRVRPDAAGHLVEVSSASFPSSHSAGAMLTCAALLLAFRAGAGAWGLAGMFVIAIGLSRVALGVHWPSDVLAGWGVGLLWAIGCARLLDDGPLIPPPARA